MIVVYIVFSVIALAIAGWLTVFFVHQPIVKESRLFGWLGIEAFVLFPLVVVAPGVSAGTKAHEYAHWHQQRTWVIRFFGFAGLFLWLAVYFLLLPIGFNPMRRRWERKAFAAEGFSQEEADIHLRGWPHLLWL